MGVAFSLSLSFSPVGWDTPPHRCRWDPWLGEGRGSRTWALAQGQPQPSEGASAGSLLGRLGGIFPAQAPLIWPVVPGWFIRRKWDPPDSTQPLQGSAPGDSRRGGFLRATDSRTPCPGAHAKAFGCYGFVLLWTRSLPSQQGPSPSWVTRGQSAAAVLATKVQTYVN